MRKIGLFYGGSTSKTTAIALQIQEAFGKELVELIPVEDVSYKQFHKYDNLIAGTSTWFDGELPTYWDELLPAIDMLDLTGKKVAIFGLGDQHNYPDNFADGIGLLADSFRNTGATLAGFTSAEGYQFNKSAALKENRFLGLVLDTENQPTQTDERIRKWVDQLRKEFKIKDQPRED